MTPSRMPRKPLKRLEGGGAQQQFMKTALVEAVEFAFSLGDHTKVRELVGWIDELRPGERPPYLRAQAARFRAQLRAVGGPADVEPAFTEAEETFTQIGMPFWFAVTQLEHTEWLIANGRDTEARSMLADATHTFERLQARPWLDRAMKSAPAEVVTS